MGPSLQKLPDFLHSISKTRPLAGAERHPHYRAKPPPRTPPPARKRPSRGCLTPIRPLPNTLCSLPTALCQLPSALYLSQQPIQLIHQLAKMPKCRIDRPRLGHVHACPAQQIERVFRTAPLEKAHVI